MIQAFFVHGHAYVIKLKNLNLVKPFIAAIISGIFAYMFFVKSLLAILNNCCATLVDYSLW